MRTISFDSSTTVDDISMTTSLQNNAVDSASPKNGLKMSVKRLIERLPLNRRRSSDGDWSDARVRISGKGNNHHRLGVRRKAPATLISEEEGDHDGDREILRTP